MIPLRHLSLSLLIALSFGALAACAAVGQPQRHNIDHMIVMTPEELDWQPIGSLPSGAELATIEGSLSEVAPFTVRLRFPAGYELPAHWHPAVERVTVISGTFNMGMGDVLDRADATELPQGSVKMIPIGTHHYAFTDEETVVQLHGHGPWGIVYVNPAHDPRRGG